MRKFVRVFLKGVVFFFVAYIGWGMGSFYYIVILEKPPLTAGIPALFLFGAPIVAYYVSFSKWANETIWKWVDENILNMFSNNNSISTSERNEAIGYLKQGNNEYRNGRFNEAIKYYTKAIEIDSNFKEAYVNRDKARNKLL